MTDQTNFKTAEQLLAHLQNVISAKKDKKNDFGGFDYRTKEGIVAEIKSHIKGIATITFDDEVVMIGNRYYIKSVCTLMLSSNGTSIFKTGWARESEKKAKFDDPMLTGSASSYAGKYAVQNLMAIAEKQDDPDYVANQQPQQNQAPQQNYQQEQQQNNYWQQGVNEPRFMGTGEEPYMGNY